MKLSVKCGMIGLLTVLAVSLTGCSPKVIQQPSIANPKANSTGDTGSGKVTMLNNTPAATLPILKHGDVSYVSGNRIAELLQFNTKWDANRVTYQIGDFDATFELKANSRDALVDEDTISLAQAPILHQSMIYIPVSALAQLFSDYTSFEISENEVKVHPSSEITVGSIDGPEEPNTGGEEDFLDDPNDPFKGEEPAAEEGQVEDRQDVAETWVPIFNGGRNRFGIVHNMATKAEWDVQSIPAANLKNINLNQLISKAKKYMGVKYLFGAPPYPQSSKFDCSTFTRYIYGRYGIQLARTARAQSSKGKPVSRNQLRKGDLMFFYVPGRFRTNKTVGHVGIYMGNSRIIHSSPEPKNGVQITNINKAYWKKTFLRARRLAD
jgi:cell wall-associated NlpC family hydrolase